MSLLDDSQTKDTLSEQRQEILKLIHNTHRDEIKFHRDVMNRLFQWTSSVYLAIVGGIFAIGKDKFEAYGNNGRIFISCAIFLIFIFFVRQSLHSASAINSNARVVVRCDLLLHLFDEGFFGDKEPLYPKIYMAWGTNKKGAGYYERNNILITLLLTVGILSFVWLI